MELLGKSDSAGPEGGRRPWRLGNISVCTPLAEMGFTRSAAAGQGNSVDVWRVLHGARDSGLDAGIG
jgi:plasmid stabilization system protein ParE